jgi:hypothetical protein
MRAGNSNGYKHFCSLRGDRIGRIRDNFAIPPLRAHEFDMIDSANTCARRADASRAILSVTLVCAAATLRTQ